MTDNENKSIESMLQFHESLSQQEFTPKLIAKIEKSAKLRKNIMLLFLILAIVISGFLFSFLKLENTMNILFSQHSIYLFSLIIFFFVANCTWLITEEN